MVHVQRARRLALLAILCAATPAAGQDARAPGEATAPRDAAPSAISAAETAATRGMADLVHLLRRKGTIRPEDAERLPAPEAGPQAVEELARYLFVRAHLTEAHLDAIMAWLGSPSGSGFARAYTELVRGLFESGVLSDPDLEALLSPDGVRRIPYVPELARVQIREQLRREILDQMKREGWATPRAMPEWTKRIRFRGDVRTRYELALFPAGNDTENNFDFAAVNASSSGLDVTFHDVATERYYNVDQDRSMPRLRARLGLDADVVRGLAVGFRLASGDSSSPVSTNQTLGGSGGSFAKQPIWIDRAVIHWGMGEGGTALSASAGRFENPFLSTDLVWDEDVSLDGLALRTGGRIGGVSPFLVAGAFPLYTTPFDLPSDRQAKVKSRDKWLYAAQAGVEVRSGARFAVRLGAAFYDFEGVEGRISSPCDIHIKGASCNTDGSRPSFAQKGNTYFELRTPTPQALLAELGGGSLYQYFGLASSFRVLAGTLRAEIPLAPVTLTFEGEAVWNVGFRRGQVAQFAVNNCGAEKEGEPCNYEGSDKGLAIRLGVGSRALRRLGDWSVAVGYRYVESDAVIDAFTDSDFGRGGTNLKGFVAAGVLGLAEGVTAGIRWSSADEVAGPRYAVDVLQVDLSARY